MLIAACPCLFVAVSRRRVLPVSSAAAPRPGKVHVQILLRPSHLAVTMAVIATARPASAEETYPIRPIRLIVPFPPGGPTDVMGRLISQGLSDQLGQQVYVDNRPGAGSTLAAKIAANAEPDGYTLLLGSAAMLAVRPALYHDAEYDPKSLCRSPWLPRCPMSWWRAPKRRSQALASSSLTPRRTARMSDDMLPTSLPNWKIKRPVARFLVAYNCLPMWMG